LHPHRKQIETNAARIAAGRYLVIQRVLGGVDLRVVEPWTRKVASPVEKMSVHPCAKISCSQSTAVGDRGPVVGYGGHAMYANVKQQRALNGGWNNGSDE
jgi:hypothetical protein